MPFQFLVQDSDCTASVAHTWVTYWFAGVDRHRGGDVSGCDVV